MAFLEVGQGGKMGRIGHIWLNRSLALHDRFSTEGLFCLWRCLLAAFFSCYAMNYILYVDMYHIYQYNCFHTL